jgi:hypothetical protein
LRGRACRNWHGFGLRAGAALLAAALLGAGGALPVSAAASSDSVARGADTRGDSAANPPIVLYLARRHWHIDVGFSVSDLNPSLAFIARRFPRARYVFFGFGDRHYLLSKRKGSSSLSGALIPGPGIILVTALENTPTQAFGASQVLEFDLSAVETAAAQSFVRRTLSGEQGMTEIPSVADGPYEGSLYWAAETLSSAGLPVRTRLVLLAGQLWKQALKVAARAPAASTLHRGVLAPRFTQNRQSQGGGLPF